MSNINEDIEKLRLSELFDENTDGGDDQSMGTSSHPALEDEAGITTSTISVEELLEMDTEPPSDDLDAELQAAGKGSSALSGTNDPNPNAEGDEAEGDDDGEDRRRSEEDETTCPPESATMEVVEKNMVAAYKRFQDLLDKAGAEHALYMKLKTTLQRGSRATSHKKDQGTAEGDADPLRKVSQKSKTAPGLKKTPTKAGKPDKSGPASSNGSSSKKVWYNWKKSGLRLRIPREVLVRALKDQVGSAFSNTVDWTTMPVNTLVELVCILYVSLFNRRQITSLPKWIPDLYGAMSYSNQDLFDRIQDILDSPDSGWAAVLANDGDKMSASINVPDHVKPKQQHCALTKPKSSPTAASNSGRFPRPPTDVTTAIRLIKHYAETIKLPESLATKGVTSKTRGKPEGRHSKSPSPSGNKPGGSRGSTRGRRGGPRCRSRSPSLRRSRSRSPPTRRGKVKNPNFSRSSGEYHSRKGKR